MINDCDSSSLPSDETDDDGDGYVECKLIQRLGRNYSVIGGEDCDDASMLYNAETLWYQDLDGDGSDSTVSMSACVSKLVCFGFGLQ